MTEAPLHHGQWRISHNTDQSQGNMDVPKLLEAASLLVPEVIATENDITRGCRNDTAAGIGVNRRSPQCPRVVGPADAHIDQRFV